MFELASAEILRVVQVTDTHLFGDASGTLLGVPTYDSLNAVLDQLNGFEFAADALLVTGDLSQDGSEQSYRLLDDALSRYQAPAFWLPGNHDTPCHFEKVGYQKNHLHKVIRAKHWQIVMLDSQVEGAVFGELKQSELDLLQQTLIEQPALNTLVCLHHHPISMNSAWIDDVGLRNRSELMDILGRHDNAKAVVWGHVHQSCDGYINGVRLMSTPSTCIQFEPQTSGFSLDDQAPGFRWLELHKDGRIRTGIERLSDVSFDVDRTQTGY